MGELVADVARPVSHWLINVQVTSLSGARFCRRGDAGRAAGDVSPTPCRIGDPPDILSVPVMRISSRASRIEGAES